MLSTRNVANRRAESSACTLHRARGMKRSCKEVISKELLSTVVGGVAPKIWKSDVPAQKLLNGVWDLFAK